VGFNDSIQQRTVDFVFNPSYGERTKADLAGNGVKQDHLVFDLRSEQFLDYMSDALYAHGTCHCLVPCS
jgi:hypothetical protein